MPKRNEMTANPVLITDLERLLWFHRGHDPI